MDAMTFAKDWEAGWNSHDLDRIMAHYHDDIVFRSQKAVATVGQGEIRGTMALRAYWARALKAQPDLRFRVVDVFAGHEMIAITYLNHREVLAVETLVFGPDGRAVFASACHRVLA